MAEIMVLVPGRAQNRQICETLRQAGHQPTAAHSAAEAERALGERKPLTIFDAQIPFTRGYPLMMKLAERGTPVLFITSDERNINHLKTMYRGECRVLLQPFTPVQLTYAVHQLLRTDERTLTMGCLSMDMESRQVTLDGEKLALTAQEYALLEALMRSPDEALSRQELLRTAWGYQSMGMTRTVDVHIQRLRRKLGPASIETVYRTGYRLRMA